MDANKKNNDSKKITTLLVLIFTLMVSTTGATYAFLAFSATDNSATGTVAASGLSLTVSESELRTNTSVMVPQQEAALGDAISPTYKCVDGNGNIVCKVYTINVSTTSTASTPTIGTIAFTTPTTNLKWKLISSATSVTAPTVTSANEVTTTNAASTTATTFASPTFTSTAKTFTYYMIIWINETGTEQNDSGTWRATIAFNSETGGITSTIRS